MRSLPTDDRISAAVTDILRDLAPDVAAVADERSRRRALADVLTVRPPEPIAPATAALLDELLTWENAQRPVVDAATLPRLGYGPPRSQVTLWQGDITTLRIDAIVNAANSQMLGCFIPGHTCIDNIIHAIAGPGLRAECAAHMDAQGHPEPTGSATLTGGYHLPATHVLHTVGPIVPSHAPSVSDAQALASCYRSCLRTAADAGLGSIAFCCISTGVFGYPIEAAARVAVEAVTAWLAGDSRPMHVVFNTFSDGDTAVYAALLGLS